MECKSCNSSAFYSNFFNSHSIYDNGDYCIGEFRYGKRHGQTTYWHQDGKKHVGEYRNGKKNGKGTTYYADGRKYDGEWKDNKCHGKGIEYTADRQIFREGVWADDVYVGNE